MPITRAMAPEVSIIVPLAAGPAQALRCFEGIATQPEQPTHEIIVVDDASVGLDALLSRLDGDVRVVRSDRRIGFSAAARLGLAHAGADVVVLLREAAVPSSGWLQPLTGALADPGVGLVAGATAGLPGADPVTAWAVGARATNLRATGIPDVPDALTIGALALAVSQAGLRVTTATASVVAPPGARTGGIRRAPGEAPELTVVIPTLDSASARVRACLAAVQATTDAAHEIVILDNGCPPQGFASPVNAGLRAARTPYVVVMNDDVEPLAGWWPPLREALDTGATVAFPLTVDGPMRFDFPAWCFAMTSEAVDEFSHAPGEFFDPSLVVWYQDTDLLQRLRVAGRPPLLAEQSRVRHGLSATVMSDDPELAAWIAVQTVADRERFLAKHPGIALSGHALAPQA